MRRTSTKDCRIRAGATLALVLFTGTASASLLEDVERSLDRFLEAAIEAHQIPGLALAVTRGEEIVYVRALGVRSLDSRERLVPESLFHMASVSKPFVATAIVQLVERGLIALDAPVTRYLPYFQLGDERYREITIRQMLDHTSGMPDVEDYEWDEARKSEAELVASMTDPLSESTFAYALGNWHLYHLKDEKRAREYFERAASTSAWTSLGFIGAEADLARLSK